MDVQPATQTTVSFHTRQANVQGVPHDHYQMEFIVRKLIIFGLVNWHLFFAENADEDFVIMSTNKL